MNLKLIVWVAWKDIYSKNSGGAEIVSHKIRNYLSKYHKIILISPRKSYLPKKENLKHYEILRPCNIFLLPFFLFLFSRKKNIEIFIEEINTIPFFSKIFVKAKKKFLFFHQLAEKIWFYETIFPISLIGFVLEKIYLKFMSDMKVITISKSTKKNLMKYGFKTKKILLINQILNEKFKIFSPKKINSKIKLVYFGSLRKMKNVNSIIRIFSKLIKIRKNYSLSIVSKELKSIDNRNKIIFWIKKYKIKDKINLISNINDIKKFRILRSFHINLFASIKEGWGLVISEMAFLGIPSVAFNVDGVRDSIINNYTGKISNFGDDGAFVKSILDISNKKKYETFSRNCIKNSIVQQKKNKISFYKIKQFINK